MAAKKKKKTESAESFSQQVGRIAVRALYLYEIGVDPTLIMQVMHSESALLVEDLPE